MVRDWSERVRVRSLSSSQAHWTLPSIFQRMDAGRSCLRRGRWWLREDLELVLFFSLSVRASDLVSMVLKIKSLGVVSLESSPDPSSQACVDVDRDWRALGSCALSASVRHSFPQARCGPLVAPSWCVKVSFAILA